MATFSTNAVMFIHNVCLALYMVKYFLMNNVIIVTAQDPVLNNLNFKLYQDTSERQVTAFLPGPEEPQIMTIETSWGAHLTASRGYLLINDIDSTDDIWPIAPEIFSKSYIITRPGYCMKIVPTFLVPLIDLTNGDEDQLVSVQTLEGLETVRAGDFFLARGVNGEIWPFPKRKIFTKMKPAK